MPNQTTRPSLLCIGAGAANLGLAALAKSVPENQIKVDLAERRHNLSWHENQILPGTTLQNSWYRDLVMSADPTSHFTFANFLHHQGRLQRFLTSGIAAPSRAEISQYFQWVGTELGTVETGVECTSLRYDPASNLFDVGLQTGSHTSRRRVSHISVGTGTQARQFRDQGFGSTDRVVYASDLARCTRCASAKRILVVGGGQSGAESFLHAIATTFTGATDREVTWITRGSSFRALDTGHLARDFFAAGFPRQFFAMTEAERQRLNSENATGSTGISPHTLSSICETLYNAQFATDGQLRPRLRPYTELLDLEVHADGAHVSLRRCTFGQVDTQDFDLVILCLGHRQMAMSFVQDMLGTPDITLNSDYSVKGSAVPDGRVFVQSDAVKSHGFSDTNFVSAPHRNAVILNAILGKQHFRTQDDDLFAEFNAPEAAEMTRDDRCLSTFG